MLQTLSKLTGTRPAVLAVAIAGLLLTGGCGSGSSSSKTTAPPTFTPLAGTYTSSQTVTISDSTPGAAIYCTTDGSAPSTSSAQCSQPITVSKTETINAVAVASGYKASGVVSAAYTINLPAAPTPVISPAAGTYTSAQTVTISDAATSPVTIYYTTDGTTPSTASTVYSAPITVSTTETIKAIAAGSALSASATASSTFTINPPTATPVISPAGGTFTSAQTVTISDSTSGAVIYYSIDGSTPNSTYPQYSGPITVSSKDETIKAIALAPGYSTSAVATATFDVNLTAAMPTFSEGNGTYTTVQSVTISDATSGAAIYYAINGTPSTSSTLYTGAITVDKTETISAIAVAPGYANSQIATAAFTINLPAAATPSITPGTGTYTTAQAVTMSDTTAGAAIYYTLDGTPATPSSTPYTGPITVSKSETVTAIAIAPGYSSSTAATAIFTFNQQQAATPVFTEGTGTYNSIQTVTISDPTPGALIYYTVDNTTPSSSSTPYAGPITVAASETLRAIATASGYNDSPEALAIFTIDLPPAPAPTFSPGNGTYGSAQNVTLSDSISGATIYYTLDGTSPTTSSTPYTGAIPVSATETITAIATAYGYSTSASSSATITIVSGPVLTGTVLGGLSPVASASVQLYAAGQTGYGSQPAALLSTPVLTDTTGKFSMVYNCQYPDDQMYLVASGGDAGNGTNSSISLMTALGTCSTLGSSPVTINEVTTVASAYALSGFMTTAPNVGSSSSNVQGLTNAFNTVGNLVDIGSGAARTITPAYAAHSVPYLNSSTVPQARINTLADILNVCVAGASSGCNALFTTTPNTGGTIPTDTLQAALNIAQNPGAKVSERYDVVSTFTNVPYKPTLSAAPNDWTLALTFTGGGLGLPPSISVTKRIGNTAMEIDALGNIWIAGYASAAPIPSSMIAGFNNLGAAITPATTYDTATSTATYGGYSVTAAGPQTPQILTIDQSGNLWVAGSGFAEIATVPGLATTLSNIQPGNTPESLAVDASGNVWASTSNAAFYELSSTGNILHQYSNSAASSGMSGFIFDSNGNLWGIDRSANKVYAVSPSNGTTLGTYATNASKAYLFVGADNFGNVYAENYFDSGYNVYTTKQIGKVSTINPQTTNCTSVGLCGGAFAMDGLEHIWSVVPTLDDLTPGTLDEITTAGTVISPVNGYNGTGNGESSTLTSAGGNSSAAMAVDGSGNLWVMNSNTGDSQLNGNVLVEFVGIAAPTATPTALALQNGTLGTRP